MICLSSFKLSEIRMSNPNIYPYNVFRNKYIEPFVFAPITVFYGNNGSGKSTILNIIANKLKLKGKEYPTSRYIKSEDILYEIKKIQQRQVLSEGKVYDYVKHGMSASEARTFLESQEGSKQQCYIELAQEKYSNGEVSGGQFIIATHSPFMLGTLDAKIYNIDSVDYDIEKWSDLEKVRCFYDFFQRERR